jgi:hypothetical protein
LERRLERVAFFRVIEVCQRGEPGWRRWCGKGFVGVGVVVVVGSSCRCCFERSVRQRCIVREN